MSLPINNFDHQSDLFAALNDTVITQLQQALNERGQASLVVSGGNTPKPLFETLSQTELDWSDVTITLADERWVDPNNADSNERLVRETLLQNQAKPAHFVSLKTDHDTPEAGMADCNARLMSITRPYDLVLLGMGGDGHTASLFPCSEQLTQGLSPQPGQLCQAVHPTTAPHARMTQTLTALLNARQIILLITGKDKLAVLQQAAAADSPLALPIAAVINSSASVTVYYTD